MSLKLVAIATLKPFKIACIFGLICLLWPVQRPAQGLDESVKINRVQYSFSNYGLKLSLPEWLKPLKLTLPESVGSVPILAARHYSLKLPIINLLLQPGSFDAAKASTTQTIEDTVTSYRQLGFTDLETIVAEQTSVSGVPATRLTLRFKDKDDVRISRLLLVSGISQHLLITYLAYPEHDAKSEKTFSEIIASIELGPPYPWWKKNRGANASSFATEGLFLLVIALVCVVFLIRIRGRHRVKKRES